MKEFGLFRLAFVNVTGRPMRSGAVFAGIAVMALTVFMLSAVSMSVSRSVRLSIARLGADALVVSADWEGAAREVLLSGEPSAFYMDKGIAARLMEIEGVKAVSSQLFIVSAPLSCCTVSDTMLVGYEPGTDFTVGPWLRDTLKRELKEDEVVVGADILAEPGGRIRFYGAEFRIAGKLEPTGMRFMDSAVFIPMAGARRMIKSSPEKALKTLDIDEGSISAVLLRFSRETKPYEAAVLIEYKEPGLKVVLSGEVASAAREGLRVPILTALFVSAFEWAAALFMIAVIYSLSIGAREDEIVLMRRFGARRLDVLRMFFYEIFLISGAAGAAGVVSGALAVSLFGDLIKVSVKAPYLTPAWTELAVVGLATLGLSLLFGLLAAAWPALRWAKRI